MEIASTFFDKLFGTYGSGHPGKQPVKFARTLITEFSLASVTFLIRHAGEIIPQKLFTVKGWQSSSIAPSALWRQVVSGKYRTESSHLVPILSTTADDITEEHLVGIVVLEGRAESLERLHKPLLRRIGLYAARLLQNDAERRLLHAHHKLAAIQNRAAVSADVYYHVARQIRKTLHLPGGCIILSWRKQALEPVAVLRGEAQRSHVPARKSRRPENTIAFDHNLTHKDFEGIEAFICDRKSNQFSVLIREAPAHHDLDFEHDHFLRSAQGLRIETDPGATLSQALQHVLQAIENKGWGSGASCVVCPLTWRHTFLGAVFIWSEVENAFTLKEALIARDLASYCVPAMARDQRIEAELDLLEQTARVEPEISLRTNPSLQAFLATLCRRFRLHRSADLVALIPYNHRTGEMQLELAASSPRMPIPTSTPTFEGSLRRVLDLGELEWHASEPSYSFGEDSFVKKEKIASFFAVALKMEKFISEQYKKVECPIGVLFVDYKRERRHFSNSGGQGRLGFSEYEKNWIRHYAKIAQDYLSVYSRLAWQHRVDEAIKVIYQNLTNENADPEKILDDILATGVDLVEATAGVLAIPSNDFYGLWLRKTKEYPEEIQRAEIEFGQGVTGACAKYLKPMVIAGSDDPATWPPHVKPLRWVPDSKSEMAVPLLSDDSEAGLIGVLNVDSKCAVAAFGEQEKDALQRLAAAGVIAINLLRDLRQKQSIVKISEEIKRLRSEDEIYRVVLQEIVDVTGAFVAIARGPDPTQRFLIKKVFVSRRSAHNLMSEEEELTWSETPLPLDRGLTAQAFHNKKTEIIKDT